MRVKTDFCYDKSIIDSVTLSLSYPQTVSTARTMNQPGRWCVWIWGVLLPGVLWAAAPPTDQTTPEPGAVQVAPDEQPVAGNEKHVKPPPTLEQKRKVVVLTSLVIVGILAVLLCLLLWIVWWSRRTHRLLRAPLPAANRGDELWYLKAKRPPNQTPDATAPDSPPTPPAT